MGNCMARETKTEKNKDGNPKEAGSEDGAGPESYSKAVVQEDPQSTWASTPKTATSKEQTSAAGALSTYEGSTLQKSKVSTTKLKKAKSSKTSFNKPKGSGTSLNKPKGSGTSLNKSRGSASSLRKPKGSGTSLNKPKGSASSLRKPKGLGTSLNKPKDSTSSLRKPKGSGTSLNKPKGSGTSLNKSKGSKSSSKKAKGSDSSQRKPKGSKSNSKKAKGSESNQRKPKGSKSSLRKSKGSKSSPKKAKGSESSLRKGKSSNSRVGTSKSSVSSLRSSKTSRSSVNKNHKSSGGKSKRCGKAEEHRKGSSKRSPKRDKWSRVSVRKKGKRTVPENCIPVTVIEEICTDFPILVNRYGVAQGNNKGWGKAHMHGSKHKMASVSSLSTVSSDPRRNVPTDVRSTGSSFSMNKIQESEMRNSLGGGQLIKCHECYASCTPHVIDNSYCLTAQQNTCPPTTTNFRCYSGCTSHTNGNCMTAQQSNPANAFRSSSLGFNQCNERQRCGNSPCYQKPKSDLDCCCQKGCQDVRPRVYFNYSGFNNCAQGNTDCCRQPTYKVVSSPLRPVASPSPVPSPSLIESPSSEIRPPSTVEPPPPPAPCPEARSPCTAPRTHVSCAGAANPCVHKTPNPCITASPCAARRPCPTLDQQAGCDDDPHCERRLYQPERTKATGAARFTSSCGHDAHGFVNQAIGRFSRLKLTESNRSVQDSVRSTSSVTSGQLRASEANVYAKGTSSSGPQKNNFPPNNRGLPNYTKGQANYTKGNSRSNVTKDGQTKTKSDRKDKASAGQSGNSLRRDRSRRSHIPINGDKRKDVEKVQPKKEKRKEKETKSSNQCVLDRGERTPSKYILTCP